MLTSFGERLRSARKDLNVSGPDLARQIGVTAQTVSEWERNKYQPTADKLPVLAAAVGVTIDWLLTGRGQNSDLEGKRTGRLVPKIDFNEVVDLDRASKDGMRDTVLAHFPCGPRSFQLTIIDRSNAPPIELGDSVIIDPEAVPVPGDMVLVVAAGKPLFRKWKPRGKKVLLEPLNPDWEADTLPVANIQVKGVMTEHTRPRRG